MSHIKEFQHLKISLEIIKSATNNFEDSKSIGHGGFGKVYEGELALSNGITKVAVKRLDTRFGQGTSEFWKEILFLSQHKHDNLVSLLGFCDETGENILVYEYLSNRSLDKHLSSTKLSWKQRLHICIGSALGLQYLHDPNGTQQRVLHRDIKSANILLDENWNAKISDFGLSKFGPANQQFTFLFSNAAGTFGYCDPLYIQTGILTKESDVYSFGVVLFEILCGRPCIQNHEDIRKFLTAWARKCYEEKELGTIIPTSIKVEISPMCLERFSAIAYQCLNMDRSQRPSMAEIVKELEIALQFQVEYEFEREKKSKHHVELGTDSDKYWETKLPPDWELITKTFKIPHAIYTDKKKLVFHLRNGLPFGKDDKFFWINNDGKKSVLLSATRFIDVNKAGSITWIFQRDLRFSRVALAEKKDGIILDVINCHVKASMLSLGTTYAAILVFKYLTEPNKVILPSRLMKIRWKMEGLHVRSMHLAQLTPDNWYKINMFHFLCHGPNIDFDLVIEELSYVTGSLTPDLLIQGIEFLPIEMIEHEEDIDDASWEKKLPNEYQRIMQMLAKPMHCTTKKEMYLLLCAGFLVSDDMWYSLCKSTGGICIMFSATSVFDGYGSETLTVSESRFKVVRKLKKPLYDCNNVSVQLPVCSSECVYACYMVFKFEDNHLHIGPDHVMEWELRHWQDYDNYTRHIRHGCKVVAHFNSAPENVATWVNIPTVKLENDPGLQDLCKTTEVPASKTPIDFIEKKVHTWMEKRNDGWMEVMLCVPIYDLQDGDRVSVNLKSIKGGYDGIVVEGIEFRPIPGNLFR